jgi:hypothetical protein
VVVHPGNDRPVVVAWRSPIHGVVSIRGGVADLDATGGDGVRWYIDKNTTLLGKGKLANGARQAFRGLDAQDLNRVYVAPGDFIFITIDQNQDYSFDSTLLELTITLQ